MKFLGQYTIEQIQPQLNGNPSKIKVKVRLDRNGIFGITQASIIDPNDELPGKKFPKKTNKSKYFSIEQTMDTKLKIDNNTDLNTSTTNDSLDEVNSFRTSLIISSFFFFKE